MANKKRTRRRLKKWIKTTLKIILTILIIILFYILISKGLSRWDRYGRWCDYEKGYTCSIKEVQDYARTLKR